MDTATFLQSIIEQRESFEVVETPPNRIGLRCLLSSSESSQTDFESFVLLAAQAALWLPQLEVIELWGACIDSAESRAYIFRYFNEDGRAKVVWRSSEITVVAPRRVMETWNEVAQKHLHSTVTCDVIPFAETNAEVFNSDGNCIQHYLLLRDLGLDPVTQTMLENDPFVSRSEFNPFDGASSVENSETDDDFASLQVEALELQARIEEFLQEQG